MEIKITVTLPSEVSALILKALGKSTDCQDTVADRPAKPTPAKETPPKKQTPQTSKKGKAAKEPEPEPEEETEEPDEEPEETEEPTEGDEPDEEPEEELVSADEQKKLKAALRGYSDKHGRQAAAAILLKYGKTSGDVKQKDLPKLLKALKV